MRASGGPAEHRQAGGRQGKSRHGEVSLLSGHRRICEEVDRRFEEQVEFIGKLVRYRSLRNHELPAQDFLQGELERRGFIVRRFTTDAALVGRHPAFSPMTVDCADSWNLVGVRKADTGAGRSLAFNSHVDVVPAGSADR